MAQKNADRIREAVREGYGKAARRGSLDPSPCCCGSEAESHERLAQRIGYSKEELAGLPPGANLGLSCGNPLAIASIQRGETVLDLGCGGGFDAFQAGQKTGPKGRVIGVDMTPDMLAKARRNLEAYTKRTGRRNVEFRLGEIEHLPVADRSVDLVISNCVLNLSPDKDQVWREVARVLKPGGRAAISDLALWRPLPKGVKDMMAALLGCIAGAVLVKETERMIKKAGLIRIRLTPHPDYVAFMLERQGALFKKIQKALPRGKTPADYLTSLSISAQKLTR